MDLVVRPWVEADAEALDAAVAASLDHLTPWMAWAREGPMRPAARRAWIRDRRREAAGGGDESFGAFLGAEVVGACGLHRRIGPGGLEIGYWVAAAQVRRGIATAMVADLVGRAFARPSVTRLEIHHDPANVASGRVAAAAGFRRVGESGGEIIWRLERRRT